MTEITIKAPIKIWTWKAIYKDGTELNQFDGDKENGYKDIDRSKLEYFELYDDDQKKFSMKLHEEQRLIFRRRNFIDMTGIKKGLIYLVGYQYNDSTGKNHRVINYVHNTGLIELDDDRQDLTIHPQEES